MGQLGNFFSPGLKKSKVRRIFIKNSSYISALQPLLQILKIHKPGFTLIGHLINPSFAAAVFPGLGKNLRIHRRRHQKYAFGSVSASHHTQCDPERGRNSLAAVIIGIAYHIRIQKLSHHTGILEDRLHFPMIGIRIATVACQELSSGVDLITQGRHLVLVAACTQKTGIFLCRNILFQDPHHMLLQCMLTQDRFRKIQPFFVQQFLWDHTFVNVLNAFHP